MTITTYVNTADKYVLDKSSSLTTKNLAVSIQLKDDSNFINPTIIISNSLYHDFNYCYIAEFDRYYYVKDITYSQQRYYVQLEVDVLMSFKTEIAKLKVIANRSSSYYNTYQKDDSIPFENRSIISTQPFSAGFGGESMLLAVNGGGIGGGN